MTLNEWIVKAETSKLEFIKKYDKGWSPIDDITYLPFIAIKKEIPDLMSDGKFDEAIAIVLSEQINQTLKRTEIERFRILIWIEKQYEKINAIEKRYLERPPDFKMLAAGIKTLDVLGFYNTTSMICEKYPAYKIEEVEQLPYSRVFEMQLHSVLMGDIQKKMIEQNKTKPK